jgi:acyl dehydratase
LLPDATKPAYNPPMRLPLGERFQTQGRTIGEGDFSALCNLTWTTGNSHTDREFMAGRTGERWLAVPCVAAVVVGLTAKHWFSYVFHKQYGIRILESRHLEVESHLPVVPGDTLHADCEVVEAKGDLLLVEERAVNQRGEHVATVRQRLRVEAIPEGLGLR